LSIERLIFLSVAITLFGNGLLAIVSVPSSVIMSTFIFRDLLTIITFLLIALGTRYNMPLSITLVWIVCAVLFAISFVLTGYLSIAPFIEKIRNMFAIPAFCFAIIQGKNYGLKDTKLLYVFGMICLVEAAFIATNNSAFLLEIINLRSYLDLKNTEVGYSFGFLGQHRLLTPMFQPSLGGIFLAAIIITFYRRRNWFFATILVIPLLLTLSKSGIILLMLWPVLRMMPVTTIFLVGLAPFVSVELLHSIKNIHVSSVIYHFQGFFEGFHYFLSPQGVGNTGTVGSLQGRQVGAESGLGAFLAAFGAFGLVPIFVMFTKRLDDLAYIFLLSVMFTEIALNLYVALFFIMIIPKSTKGNKSAFTA
jgi:hypothetical protein